MPDVDLVVEVPVDEPSPPNNTEAASPKAGEAEVRIEAEAGAERKRDEAGRFVADAPAAPPIEPIADLRAQLDALTAQKAEESRQAADRIRQAEAAAARAAEEATRAKAEVADSNLSAVDSAIHAAKTAADGFQREQQAAFESGDYAKAADFGRKMAREEAKITRLEEGKADLDAIKRDSVAKKADSVQTRVAAPADSLEAVLQNVSPRSAAWLRAHPQYVTDEKMARKAQIADLEALDNGFIRDTDAYFDFCEQKLGLKAAPKTNGSTNGSGQQQQTTQRTTQMPAAPPSRGDSPSGGQLSATQVRLTPGEQQAAQDGTHVYNYNDPNGKFKKGEPIGVKEFARRKLLMTKQGMYDKSYTDQ